MPARWRALRRSARAILSSLGGPVPRLHECFACGRDRVCPIVISEHDDDHWDITLRCGDCGLVREVRANNAEATDYESALNEHADRIRRELARLDAERMASEAEAFIEALDRDLIDAGYFSR